MNEKVPWYVIDLSQSEYQDGMIKTTKIVFGNRRVVNAF